MRKRELSPQRMIDELAKHLGTNRLTPFQEKFIIEVQVQPAEELTLRDVDYLEQLHQAVIGF